jgi:hypothetical protein
MASEVSKYLDVRQFSLRSGLPISAIKLYIKDGRLPSVRICNRTLIESSHLERLSDVIRGHAIEPAPLGVRV